MILNLPIKKVKYLYLILFCFTFQNTYPQGAEDSGKLIFSDRLFLSGPYGKYLCFQGEYAWQLSSNFFGVQVKFVKTDGEIGFSAMDVKGISLSFGKFDNTLFSNIDVNYHLRLFPYTLFFSLGGGSSFTTSFNGQNLFSIYPSVYLDLGGIEISYHYKFKIKDSILIPYSNHVVKANLGLGYRRKSKY